MRRGVSKFDRCHSEPSLSGEESAPIGTGRFLAALEMTEERIVHICLGVVCLALSSAPAWACSGRVYLTFDTGNMSQAEHIARVLKEEGVRATFFVANERTARGDRALETSWRDYWRARVAEGHVFGNHTWSHLYQRRDLPDGRLVTANDAGGEITLDRAGFCAELSQVDSAFRALTGVGVTGQWRAPGGRTTQQSLRWAASCGYPLHVHWSDAGYIGDDWPSDKHSNEALLERALKQIAAGDIVLMHLGIWSRKEPAAPILKPLIQGLKARGLCFATLNPPTP